MSKTIKVIIIAFSTIFSCVNVDNSQMKENYNFANTSNNGSDIVPRLLCNSFKCREEFLWHRLDLRLWKRRRRMSNKLSEKAKEKTVVNDGEYKPRETGSSHTTEFSLCCAHQYISEGQGLESHSRIEDMKPTLLQENLLLIEKFKETWPVKSWRKYGLFTDDYLLVINPHWLQFPPPDPRVQYAMGSVYLFMLSLGCFGNILVLFMYFRCRTLRTPGNILVANLALSDFLMLAKTPVFVFNSFNLGPALGKTGCVIYGFVGGLTGTTSIATLSAIALDRYWAVVRPLEPLRALTAIRARLMAIGAWLYAGAFSVIPALDIGYGHYVPEGYLTSCSFDYLTEELPPRYFIFIFFCAAWLAPFCTISFCYISIFRVVVCNRNITTKNQEQRLSSRHQKERTKRKAEIKLAFLVMAVIALFFVSWTPYAVVALLGIFGKKELITPLSSMIPALFCKTAACINPFIYIITHPKFRKEFKKLMCRNKSKRMDGTMKTIGYTTDTSRHRPSKVSLSDTDVEIVEMKDIPYQTNSPSRLDTGKNIKTISSRVAERQNSQTSMKSFEESIVSPPSWYSKPQFTKKKSFHRRSTRSVLSVGSDQII